MATGRLIPGAGFVIETQTNTGKLIPGVGFVIETEAAAPGGVVGPLISAGHLMGSILVQGRLTG